MRVHWIVVGLVALLALGMAAGCGVEEHEDGDLPETVGFQSLGSYLSDAPVLVDGSLYVATGNGEVHQIDPANGAILWSTPEAVTNASGPPMVTADTVFVMTYDASVVAIDRTSGEQRWRKPGEDETGWSLDDEDVTPENARCFGHDPASGILIMGGGNGMVLGIADADGTLRWARDLGAPVFAGPVVLDGIAYVNTMAGELHAIRAKDGGDIWEISTAKEKDTGEGTDEAVEDPADPEPAAEPADDDSAEPATAAGDVPDPAPAATDEAAEPPPEAAADAPEPAPAAAAAE